MQQSQLTTSAHQVIGLIASALTLIQFGLGIRNHLILKYTLTPTIYGRIHIYIGPDGCLLRALQYVLINIISMN